MRVRSTALRFDAEHAHFTATGALSRALVDGGAARILVGDWRPMPLDVPVLDAHVHFWDPRSTPREASPVVKLLGWNESLLRQAPRLFPRPVIGFLGRANHVLGPYLPGDWMGDRRGVESPGFIHVQAGWHDRRPLGPVGETRWLESLCGTDLRGIVAQASLDAPHLATLLEAHAQASARLVGVRDMTAFDPDPGVLKWNAAGDRMRGDAWLRGLALVGERGLTFDAWCYHPQLGDLASAARAAPATRIVLCHLGTPIAYGGPFASQGQDAAARARIADQWRESLARVAACPNVHAKISGLAMPVLGFGFHERAVPPSVTELVDKLGPLVEYALATFTPERCFFASNFPMDKVSAPWGSVFEAFGQLVASRDGATRRALFHDNAARFYHANSAGRG
jgi:predicted TIM-barrel fold metal-dependent hydrolase